MLKNKKKKAVRLRGTSSHAWGHKKKHRGSGNRGGFGAAGTGARGDSQKPGLLARSGGILKKISASSGVKVETLRKTLAKKGNYFGKRGFTRVGKTQNKVLSLSYLEHNFDKLVESGIIVKQKDEYVFDATLFKYDKILGKGNFSKKMTIICDSISESAKTRVEEVGGKVIVSGEESSQE